MRGEIDESRFIKLWETHSKNNGLNCLTSIVIHRRGNSMELIEFKTKIKNGVINIPEKYKQKIHNIVKVIIITEKNQRKPISLINY